MKTAKQALTSKNPNSSPCRVVGDGRMREAVCDVCGAVFTFERCFIEGNEIFAHRRFCEACVDSLRTSYDARKKLSEQLRRAHEFRALRPSAYALTEIDRLPCKKALEKILAWEYNPRGMIFCGPSGCGKTRSAWILLERQHKQGRSVACVDFHSLMIFPSRLVENQTAAMDWLVKQCAADILLLDDVLKATMTERVQEALLAIVDARISRLLPCIVTLNETPEQMHLMLGSQRAEPIIRRLIEMCECVNFAEQ